MGKAAIYTGDGEWWSPLRFVLSPFLEAEEKAELVSRRSGRCDLARVRPFLQEEGLLALAGWELSRLTVPAGQVAPPEQWQRTYLANAARTTRRTERLRPILEAARQEGIPVVLMRSPYLVERAYEGRSGLRAFADIDLALRPDHVARFIALLRDAFPGTFLLTSNRDASLRKALTGSRVEVMANDIALDLHWELTLFHHFHPSRRYSARQDAVWERTTEGDFSWGPCRVLSDPDLLAHLAEHAFIQHDLRDLPLRRIVEFARLYAAANVDRDALERVARQRGSLTALKAACAGTCALLHVPEKWVEFRRLGESGSPRAAAQGERRLEERIRSAHTPVTGSNQKLDGLVEELEATAAFSDGFAARLAFIRMCVRPKRSILSYSRDRSLTRLEYARFLLGMPLLWVALRRPISLCLGRQVEETARALRLALEATAYTALGTGLVAVYYARNLRNTGLLGGGALKTWWQRLFPSARASEGPGDRPFWVHAAGPADARSATALLEALDRRYPEARFFVTFGTRAAMSQLLAVRKEGRVELGWMPFDLRGVVRRWVRRLNPSVFINMQGEHWPNLLRELARQAVPNVALRADMLDWETQVEFPAWVRPLHERMLGYVGRFSVRAPLYGERLRKSGIDARRIVVGGDYRLAQTASGKRRDVDYAALFGVSVDCPLVVVAGPRPDEAERIVEALAGLVRARALRLLLAPVEIDACDRIERRLSRRGYRVAQRSKAVGPNESADVLLLDTYGELCDIYSVATVAIVGDSFPPVFGDGRNPWEALEQGAYALYGPQFPDTIHVVQAEEAEVSRRVQGYEYLADAVTAAVKNPPERARVQEFFRALRSEAIDPAASDVELVGAAMERRLPESSPGQRPARSIRRANRENIRRAIEELCDSGTASRGPEGTQDGWSRSGTLGVK
jgi:3-deoxy-D-manno-octulosonic-acid transferase